MLTLGLQACRLPFAKFHFLLVYLRKRKLEDRGGSRRSEIPLEWDERKDETR